MFEIFQGIFNEMVNSNLKSLMLGNRGAFNFSKIKAFENRAKGPITQGECMGAHNTCLHFVGKQNLRLCHLHLHQRQNMQVETVFQQLVLGFF